MGAGIKYPRAGGALGVTLRAAFPAGSQRWLFSPRERSIKAYVLKISSAAFLQGTRSTMRHKGMLRKIAQVLGTTKSTAQSWIREISFDPEVLACATEESAISQERAECLNTIVKMRECKELL